MTNASESEALLILDRDGVINEDSAEYIKSVEEWQPIPGSIEAIARLSRAGYTIAVASNQSGLARGLFDEQALLDMHDKMFRLVRESGGMLDAVVYCPHGPDDGCDCRKPETGLLRQIEESVDLPVAGSYLVGDSLRDLQAADRAGCKPVLVRTGKGETTLRKLIDDDPELLARTGIFANLAEFAAMLLGEQPTGLH